MIRAKKVALGYDGKVIKGGIDFTLGPGDYLCIIGENGCGKTTLMKALTGNKPPMEGEISIGGEEGKSQVGYLPQGKKERKDFPASAMEVVLSGCLGGKGWAPFYTREDRRWAREALAKVGALNLSGRRFAALSGGQQQRVLLARALCGDKSVLLLDEPTSGLDPKATEEIYENLWDLHRQGKTIVMISHDKEGVRKYATHILRLDRTPVFFGDRQAYEKAQREWGEVCD